MFQTRRDRRTFLQAAGVGLALPMLESAIADERPDSRSEPSAQRFVAIGTYLGFHTPSWFPKKPGNHYRISSVLKPIESHRERFTLLSGLDHRKPNGHANWRNFLTGSGIPCVSLDQVIAAEVGDRTRFASLQLACGSTNGSGQISFTREGIPLPMIRRPNVQSSFSPVSSSTSSRGI